jgi:phenylacetate-CoA ligase
MNSTLYRNIWRLKQTITRPEVIRSIAQKQSVYAMEQAEIETIQLAKAKKLVEHAYNRTEFYRERFDTAGIVPSDIRSMDDFARIPIVTKDDIRASIERFISSTCNRSSMRRIYSGGSTGVPTMVYHGKQMELAFLAQSFVHFNWIGLEWGDKTAHLWGLNRANRTYEISGNNRLRWFFRNTVLLDAFNLTSDRMFEFFRILQSFRPKLVVGYSSALVAFSRFLAEERLGVPGIKAVVSSAEMLREKERQLIQSGLGAPVFDLYGSTEINWIASECLAHDGLHVFEDSRIVETMEIAGTNGLNQLVVTDLENYGCPLIRYVNQDIGSISNAPCSCGRSLKKITRLQGRTSDLFILSNGRKIHGEYFTHVFYEFSQTVKQFQLHQITPDIVHVRIVPSDPKAFIEQQHLFEERILSTFRGVTGDLVHYKFEYLSEIPAEASGKFRFTKSDVT